MTITLAFVGPALMGLGAFVLWASAWIGSGQWFGWTLLAIGGLMVARVIAKAVQAVIK